MTIEATTGKPPLETMSEDECWELLANGAIGRLAVSIDNRPDIFPVNYRIDGETVVIRTAAGLKLAAAVLGRGVVFEADRLDERANTGASVVVHGTAEEIESVEDLLDAEDLGVEPWAAGEKNRYLRIVPKRITGRRIG